VFCPRVPAKTKAQAEAIDIVRTRPVRINRSQETRVSHTAAAKRVKLHVLNVERALKGAQLKPPVPELDKRQARPRENQSLHLVDWPKALQAVVTFVNPRERETEMGRGISGVLRQKEGGGRQRGRYRSEHCHGWRDALLC